ncbi:sigma 54-interacting transcriptional regulator [Desulfovibrio sp. OttesenSCG-928-O18]|nr:sigma 54-interacting transcriptional regulator [Desulfovibrio sp. OttesenSCG-928-O18]
MSNPAYAFVKPEFFLCLSFLRRPLPLRALCQVVEQGEQTVLPALVGLEREGLVRHDPGKNRWGSAGDRARERLAAMVELEPEKRDKRLLLRGLFLLRAGRLLDGGEMVCGKMENLLHAGSTAGALCCLDILHEGLNGWHYEHADSDDNARYLQLAYNILGASLYLSKRRRASLSLLSVALAVAETMGNRRIALKFKIMQICQEFFAGAAMTTDPGTAMESVVREISELGDKDIQASTVCGAALRHFSRGNFVESIACFRANPPDADNPELRFFNGIALSLVTSSACNLGRFGNAIGSMLHKLNSLAETGGQYMLRRFRILTADVLLRAGVAESALEMMSEAFACADTAAESPLVVRGFRNLAFYHFQNNNLAASHKMLGNALEVARRYNLYRPFQGFSYLYEMLWAFHDSGLPDFPGHGLEQELRKALEGPSVHQQGIALRIEARKELKGSRNHEKAARLLEDSVRRLTLCENPVETARSKLLLAECLSALGREEEAVALGQSAASVLEQYGLCAPRPGSETGKLLRQPVPPADGEALAIRCAKSFSALPDWLSFADRLQWLIDSLRDSLEAERVVLYQADGEGAFTRLAVRDFTALEERKMARAHAARMNACLKAGRPALWRSRAGAFLLLPLAVPGGRHCVFLAHSVYLTHHLADHAPGYFEPVTRVLEQELRLAFHVKSSLSAAQMAEAKRVRLAAKRNQSDSGIYYGPALQGLLDDAGKAAVTDAPVLILGETGVGKEELARRIHVDSGRIGAFVPVNPASIPEHLFESELFGHEKGAFTGAYRQKIGLLDLADQGTLFIDEVGEIPPAFQVKLLRVLQDKKYSRLGGTTILHSDFRLISATNQSLKERMRNRTFRADLYYRLAVVPLVVPPLRERPEDIRTLAGIFYERYSARYSRHLPPLPEEYLKALCACSWPGNIRELKSYIMRAVILGSAENPIPLSPEKNLPQPEAFHEQQISPPLPEPPPATAQTFHCTDLPTMKEIQRRYISHVLAQTRGKIRGENGALAILDMKQSSLYAKIREFGLDKASQLYGERADEEG